MQTIRPRRSVLYLPGASAKALEKARALPADALIFDLEDSVAPEAKPEARRAVLAALAHGGYGGREKVVRVNALAGPWGADDVAAFAGAGADGLLFPKVNAPADVGEASARMDRMGYPPEAALWAMIETPLAILDIRAIAAAAGTRLSVLVVGANDLAKESRAVLTPDRFAFVPALSLTVLAARAFGLGVIDAVFGDLKDEAGFAAECLQGSVLGFDGKSLIHPSQIAPCNAAFAPPAAEITRARAVIAAFADPANAGKGVLSVEGRMTERLHLDMARRTIALASAIAALEGRSGA